MILRVCSGLAILLLVALLQLAHAQISSYRTDDWVTYRNFRFVQSLDAGRRYGYVGTTTGLAMFDLWRKNWSLPQTQADGLIDEGILEIRADEAAGRVWVRTQAGVSYYETGMSQWFIGGSMPADTSHDEAPDLHALHLGNPFFFDGSAVRDASGSSYRITAAIPADQGNFLLGTWGLGAGYGSQRMKLAEMKPFGLRGDDVSAILVHDRYVWFGSEKQGGLSRLDLRNGNWEHFYSPVVSAFNDNRITSLAADSHAVWIGTYLGLIRYDKKEGSFDAFCPGSFCERAILVISPQPNGELLVGTDAGLCRVTPGSGLLRWITNPAKPFGAIQSLLVNRDTTWVGTEFGLYRGILQNQSSSSDSTGKSVKTQVAWQWRELDGSLLRGRSVHALMAVDSCIWAGTENGLVEVAPALTSRLLGRRKTPLERPVTCIRKLGADYWLGTSDGVVATNRQGQRWTVYTTRDGLISNEVLVCAIQDEYIWFGTTMGATRCHWKNVQDRKGFNRE